MNMNSHNLIDFGYRVQTESTYDFSGFTRQQSGPQHFQKPPCWNEDGKDGKQQLLRIKSLSLSLSDKYERQKITNQQTDRPIDERGQKVEVNGSVILRSYLLLPETYFDFFRTCVDTPFMNTPMFAGGMSPFGLLKVHFCLV